jgi:hypothetical protein
MIMKTASVYIKFIFLVVYFKYSKYNVLEYEILRFGSLYSVNLFCIFYYNFMLQNILYFLSIYFY